MRCSRPSPNGLPTLRSMTCACEVLSLALALASAWASSVSISAAPSAAQQCLQDTQLNSLACNHLRAYAVRTHTCTKSVFRSWKRCSGSRGRERKRERERERVHTQRYQVIRQNQVWRIRPEVRRQGAGAGAEEGKSGEGALRGAGRAAPLFACAGSTSGHPRSGGAGPADHKR